jgi:hypothetical protein
MLILVCRLFAEFMPNPRAVNQQKRKGDRLGGRDLTVPSLLELATSRATNRLGASVGVPSDTAKASARILNGDAH